MNSYVETYDSFLLQRTGREKREIRNRNTTAEANFITSPKSARIQTISATQRISRLLSAASGSSCELMAPFPVVPGQQTVWTNGRWTCDRELSWFGAALTSCSHTKPQIIISSDVTTAHFLEWMYYFVYQGHYTNIRYMGRWLYTILIPKG